MSSHAALLIPTPEEAEKIIVGILFELAGFDEEARAWAYIIAAENFREQVAAFFGSGLTWEVVHQVLRNIDLDGDNHDLPNNAGAMAAVCVLSSTAWAVEPAPSEGRAKILASLTDIMLRTANLHNSSSIFAGLDDILVAQLMFQTVAKRMVHMACRAAILVTDASLPTVAMRQAMRAACGPQVFALLFAMQYDGERPATVPDVADDAADAVWYLWMAWKEMTTVECSEVLTRCPAAGPALLRSAVLVVEALLQPHVASSHASFHVQFMLSEVFKAVGTLCNVIQFRGLGSCGAFAVTSAVLFFMNVAITLDMPVLGYLSAMVTTLSLHDSSVHAPVQDLVKLRAQYAGKHMHMLAAPQLGATLDSLADQARRWSKNRAAFLGAVMRAGVRRMPTTHKAPSTRKRARARA